MAKVRGNEPHPDDMDDCNNEDAETIAGETLSELSAAPVKDAVDVVPHTDGDRKILRLSQQSADWASNACSTASSSGSSKNVTEKELFELAEMMKQQLAQAKDVPKNVEKEKARTTLSPEVPGFACSLVHHLCIINQYGFAELNALG